jgi:hypothetical protein
MLKSVGPSTCLSVNEKNKNVVPFGLLYVRNFCCCRFILLLLILKYILAITFTLDFYSTSILLGDFHFLKMGYFSHHCSLLTARESPVWGTCKGGVTNTDLEYIENLIWILDADWLKQHSRRVHYEVEKYNTTTKQTKHLVA